MLRSIHNYRYILVIIACCLSAQGFSQPGEPYPDALPTNVVQNIDAIEYFFDRDPGLGNAYPIPVTPGNDIQLSSIQLSGFDTLEAGVHRLYVRSRNTSGAWSVSNHFMFLIAKVLNKIQPNAISNISRVEYFFDSDPGFGKGTDIPVSSGEDVVLNNIVIGGTDTLANGIHNLYIRTQNADGGWSITNNTSLLVVKSGLGIQANRISNISKAEYFIDKDPGFGKGTAIPLSAGPDIELNNIVIDGMDTLANGIHNLYIRIQNLDGSWSITNIASFELSEGGFPIEPNPALSNITEIEYFIDADPGNGNGIKVPVNGNPNIENIAFEVDMSSVTAGDHQLYIRVKDERGNWSIRVVEPFRVHSPVGVNWLYFNGQLSGDDVVLNWATSAESNSKVFFIERSVDAIQFKSIGSMEAKGNSIDKSTYQFKDEAAASLGVPIVYYRLRQVDQDGKFTYSIIEVVPISGSLFEPIVKVYPNPFEGIITLMVTTSESASSGDKVQLYSISGVLIYEKNISGRQNNAQIILDDLPKFGSGMYFLKTYINGQVKTIKVTHL